jgi:hypothetical protein
MFALSDRGEKKQYFIPEVSDTFAAQQIQSLTSGYSSHKKKNDKDLE